MPSSLRARLLAWYSLMLAIVIATFAGTVGYLLWRSMVADVDAAAARERAPRSSQSLRPAGGGGFDLDLPLEYQPADAAQPGPATYYAVWNARGDLIDRSAVGFDIPRTGRRPGTATRDGRRETDGRRRRRRARAGRPRPRRSARSAVRAFAGDGRAGRRWPRCWSRSPAAGS